MNNFDQRQRWIAERSDVKEPPLWYRIYKKRLLRELPGRAGIPWTTESEVEAIVELIPAQLRNHLAEVELWEHEDPICEEIIDWLQQNWKGPIDKSKRSKRLVTYQGKFL